MTLYSQLSMISILVHDQEEALTFYTQKLGLEKRTDITFGPGLRLLTVAVKGQHKPVIALARPDVSRHSTMYLHEMMSGPAQQSPHIFVTENCRAIYERWHLSGVQFLTAPTPQRYGVEALFKDPSGNLFSLLEISPEARAALENHNENSAA